MASRISPLLLEAMLREVVQATNREACGVRAEVTNAGHLLLELDDPPHTQIVLKLETK